MMTGPSRLTTFKAFWPFYLSQHRSKTCRVLHYAGTASSIALLSILLALGQWYWLWLPFLTGYAPAWIGHALFERNKPATFEYPLYSFAADFKMFYFAITGRLSDELKQLD